MRGFKADSVLIDEYRDFFGPSPLLKVVKEMFMLNWLKQHNTKFYTEQARPPL